ncbi:DUF397 domain-containing protein [Kibdelosporangium phytohabitans]|uniref:DUF397 domain-containing protein n=1 Tax=Kibdelosporangium phytohabitans TaxID=860235 RepID=UPI0009F90B5A|nr:DUF397 domain-containing protein [Kibdelosporangium phytohabitans]MBE1465298.1 hypothetical protein [Kibdelosporangium phytohabitans]
MDLAGAEWRKSSFSGTAEDCVEVALVTGTAAVRDTKARTNGTLTFPQSSWVSFARSTSR